MKKLYLILLAACTIICCKEDADDKPTFPVAIHVQSSFDQDQVQVFIDGKKWLDKVLQTNHVLGVCSGEGQLVTIIPEGTHTLKAVVNNSSSKTETFSVDKELYIGVNFDSQSDEIWFIFSDQMFVYD